MTNNRPLYYDAYCTILREELVPAMGCTEPIAVAFAAATARDILGMKPQSAEIRCSANIVKNVKSVTVPNTGGMRGITAAATAGIVGGNAGAKLEVLESVTDDDLVEVKRLLSAGFCKATLAEGHEGLYIEAIVRAGDQSAEVIIKDNHTGVSRIRKNGLTVFETEEKKGGDFAASVPARPGYDLLNVRDILEFATTVELSEVSRLIELQISMNETISDEGLKNDYGVSVGKTIVAREEGTVRSRARAR
ncbi:MAG: hypothetical protein CVV27_17155, partial [Candidatus Melainabacteria bacterium HGW-Melainabacteria-1]